MSENSFKKNTLLRSIKESAESAGVIEESPKSEDLHAETAQDLLNKVLKTKKKKAKYPHTIYLSEEISIKLEEYARQSRKSKSAFLEELLENIFPND